jgi:hypothetical protein
VIRDAISAASVEGIRIYLPQSASLNVVSL